MRHVTGKAALVAVLVLAGGRVAAPRPCAAAGAAPATPAWLQEVTLDGFLSTSYSYNFNRPPSGTNGFRVFDFDDNTFKLDVFELVAQKPVTKPRDAGFRVDVALGSSVPRVSEAAGLFRDASGAPEDLDLQQGYASYIAPVGTGLRLDLGKFVTAHGYEVIPGYDGWNDDATRSFLFGYAIPFTHMGARASYTLGPRVSGSVMVVNGWDVARDNNRSKSVGAQLALTPSASLSVTVSGMVGAERAGNESDLRSILDLVAIWKAGPRLTLSLNGDLGAEPNAVVPGEDATWSGAAGYLRYTLTSAFAVALRAEHFEDPEGARTGTRQRLDEVTATPELRVTPHLAVRSDLRIDRSSRSVFEKASGLTDTQATVLFEAFYSF